MRENETLLIKAPTKVATSNTGAFIDLQGYVNPGGREVKFVLSVGVGTTAGTAGGYIQSAEDTASTGIATVCTFATQTSAGGNSVKGFPDTGIKMILTGEGRADCFNRFLQ